MTSELLGDLQSFASSYRMSACGVESFSKGLQVLPLPATATSGDRTFGPGPDLPVGCGSIFAGRLNHLN